jgi:tetratricopeptide (TPR) repeat protein
LKALSFYQKALDIYEKLADLTLPDLAATYNNVATVFSNMDDSRIALGNYSNELLFFNKSREIQEKSLHLNHP